MMRMQMMRKLRCLAWFPCLLAFLLLPGSVHAKEYACDVTIPATVQVSGDRIPSGEVYEVVMEAISPLVVPFSTPFTPITCSPVLSVTIPLT